nr:hypothetical protein [Tanacetum cinerariifolium]
VAFCFLRFAKETALHFALLIEDSHDAVAFCLRRLPAFCLKVTAFCFKTKLRFASRPSVFCSRTHCDLSQEDTRPPMLDRTDFASWQQRIRLYCRGKDNGVNILKSINEGPYKLGTFRETLAKSTEGTPQFGPERLRVYSDLNSKEKDRYNADIRATNILLQGLPKDIYTLINHYTDAKDIWDNVKMLLERFAKLINDMRNIKMTMSKLQLNSKFMNNMLPEWGRFMTAVKLNRGLRDSNYDQLFAYLKQHEAHAKENKMMLERLSQPTAQPIADPLALLSNVSNTQHSSPSSSTSSITPLPPPHANSSSPANDLIENLTSTLALLTQSYRTFLPQTNNQLRTSSNARNQATVQDGRVVVQNNRVGNVNQGQARSGQPRTVKCYNCNGTRKWSSFGCRIIAFSCSNCDAFDSNVDEASIAQTMFMANLSSADPITDEAEPSYDLDNLSEVQDHDQYLEDTYAYQEEHVMHDSVQLDHVVDLHADYTSVSNMIPYDQGLHQLGLLIGNGGFEQTKACYLQEFIPFFTTIKYNFEGIQKALTKEVKEMKDVFKELEAEVAQCAVDRKHDAIDRKNLLIANDNLIAECLSKEVFSVATKSELNVARFAEMHVANTSRCLALEAELATLRDKSYQENQGELIKHFSKLEVDHLNLQLKYQNLKDSIGNNPPTPDKDTPDFDYVFVIGKMQASLQGKDNAIRQLKNQLSKLQVASSDTERTVKVRTTDSQLTKVTDPVTNLQAQNDLLRAENDKVKQHYKEMYDSIKITRAKHIEQVTQLTAENVTLKNKVKEAKVVRPLDRSIVYVCCYTKNSQESLEYAIDTCPQGSQQRAKQLANTPFIRKKKVTIAKPSDRQDSNKQVHVVAVKPQKTNVHVPPSIGVTSYLKASRSQPKTNPKTNRISPAKGANKLPVEDLPRTNKSHLRTTNRVDSSSRLKRTIINLNLDSICQTCNKFLTSFDHDMCVAVYVKPVVISHSTHHNCEVERKIKQVWKPKHVERKMKQVWKPKQDGKV